MMLLRFFQSKDATTSSGGEKNREDRIIKPSTLVWRSFKRDKAALVGGVMVLALLLVTLLCEAISPYDPLITDPNRVLLAPSAQHWMGTDMLGRDLFSRVLYGTRTSMIVSFGSIIISVLVGLFIGIPSGYYGGKFDNVMMRILDIWFAFPVIFLALAVVAIFRPNMMLLLLTIGFVQSVRIARVARGSVLSVKEMDFVEGVRSVGANDWSIMRFFIMPNILSPVIVQSTYFLATAIQLEASLSFLGLGTQPPMASWGLMLNESRKVMEMAPWLTVFPGIAIVIAVLAFNLMGDGLRTAFDPRMSQR